MGMGMSVSPQIWQQSVDLVFQNDLIKPKQNFDVIMDDTFIHMKIWFENITTQMPIFRKKIVYMQLEFQVEDDKVCYTPLKDKCEAIQNLDSPKTLKQIRAFCGMVNFLSSYLPDLRRLLIPIYDLQKKLKKFKWTEEAEKAFNNINSY